MQGYHPLASTYNHCYEGLLKLLIEHLGTDVDPREPAAVAGVTVVPADGIFQASDLRKSREVKEPQRSAPFPKHRLPSSGTSSTLQGAEGQTGIPTREEIFPRNRTILCYSCCHRTKGFKEPGTPSVAIAEVQKRFHSWMVSCGSSAGLRNFSGI